MINWQYLFYMSIIAAFGFPVIIHFAHKYSLRVKYKTLEINFNCKDPIKELNYQLEKKQTKLFMDTFNQIEKVIVNEFKKKLPVYYAEIKEPFLCDVDTSRELLYYTKIIHEITKVTYESVIALTRDNHLWKYDGLNWVNKKDNDRFHYMNINMKMFDETYDEDVCKIPLEWVKKYIVPTTEIYIYSLIDQVQEIAKVNSWKSHEKIEELKK